MIAVSIILTLIFFPMANAADTEKLISECEKSLTRIEIENAIDKAHEDSQSQAFQWMKDNPLRGKLALHMLQTKGTVSEAVSKELAKSSWMARLSCSLP